MISESPWQRSWLVSLLIGTVLVSGGCARTDDQDPTVENALAVLEMMIENFETAGTADPAAVYAVTRAKATIEMLQELDGSTESLLVSASLVPPNDSDRSLIEPNQLPIILNWIELDQAGIGLEIGDAGGFSRRGDLSEFVRDVVSRQSESGYKMAAIIGELVTEIGAEDSDEGMPGFIRVTPEELLSLTRARMLLEDGSTSAWIPIFIDERARQQALDAMPGE